MTRRQSRPAESTLAQACRRCREAQRAYFADRTEHNLIKAKEHERILDALLDAYPDPDRVGELDLEVPA